MGIMNVLWYVGNKKEKCNSLVILGKSLQKYSQHNIINIGSKESPLNYDADVLIGSYRYYTENTINALQNKFKCYVYVHGFVPEEESSDFMKEKYLPMKNITKLVSCEYPKRHLESCGIEDIKILPFGIDQNQFHYREKNHKDLTFGMCYQARKEHRKGYDIVERLKIEGLNIKIATNIPHNKIQDFYHSIDCLIVASDDDGRETFCIPMLEAAACGCIIITTPVGVSKDLLDLNTGIITNKKFISKFAKELDIKIARKAGKLLSDNVANNWTWKKQIKIWDKLIGEKI